MRRLGVLGVLVVMGGYGGGCQPNTPAERAAADPPQATAAAPVAPAASRPPEPPRVRPPEHVADGDGVKAVVLAAGAALRREPRADAPSFEAPGEGWVFELLGWSADQRWAKIRPLGPRKDAPREHCAERPWLWGLRPTLFVERAHLAQVTQRPVTLSGEDGTWLALMAGVPLQPAGGEAMFAARAPDLRTGFIKDAALTQAAGVSYTATPMLREAMEAHDSHPEPPPRERKLQTLSRQQPVGLLGQPPAPIFARREAPGVRVHQTSLAGLAGVANRLHPSRVAKTSTQGEVSVVVRWQCGAARVRVAEDALKPLKGGGLGALGALGDMIGGDEGLRAGATVRWPDGQAVGTLNPTHHTRVRAPLKRDAKTACFEVSWTRLGAPSLPDDRRERALVWCVDAADVVRLPRGAGRLGGLGGLGVPAARPAARPAAPGAVRRALPVAP